MKCWRLSPPFAIFAIFVKDSLSSFGPITNHLWLLSLMFLCPFRLVNSATLRSFLSSMCRCCFCHVGKMLSLIFCLAPPPPRINWNSRRLGSCGSSRFQSYGHWPKLLFGNAAFAGWLIAVPGWWRFNWCLSPSCPRKIEERHFLHLNNISHPRRLASRHMVSSRFVCSGLANDITTWARACLNCQQAKIHCHPPLLPQPIPIPQHRFSHLHIDLVGPYSIVAVS